NAGGDEGSAQGIDPEEAVSAKQTADSGAEDESEAESRAHDAEVGGAFFRRTNVGDVGHGSGEIRAGDAGENASNEKPVDVGGENENDVIDSRGEERGEDDFAAAKPIREAADDRRAHELHQRVESAERAVEARGGDHIVMRE